MKNKYKINGDEVTIYIERKDGEIFETYIDLENFNKIKDLPRTWNTKYYKCIDGYYVLSTKYIGTIDGVPKYKSILLHRFIMEAEHGDVVDHINHNGLDNKSSNLRITKQNENTKNRSGKNSNNTSGYRNVSKVGNWWYVQLQVDGVNTLLKKFPLNELEEAGRYAEEMRNKYYGEFQGVS